LGSLTLPHHGSYGLRHARDAIDIIGGATRPSGSDATALPVMREPVAALNKFAKTPSSWSFDPDAEKIERYRH
jgi:hypothetical protein